MHDPKKAIENLRDRIDESEALFDADREVLKEFSDELYLRKPQTGDYRHEKLLRHTVIMGEGVEDATLADALEDESAAKTFVGWIHRNYENEETNRDYRVALKMLGRLVSDENGTDPPASMSGVSSNTSRDYDPTPDPSNMLEWESHVLPMIDETTNTRDEACIAVAWDAGLRAGELMGLKIGDINDHKLGTQISVDGKTGQRTVLLITAVPHLQRWLADHPARNDDSAPLWTHIDKAKEAGYRTMKQQIDRAGRKAGISRPYTFTNFRKSSASHLANRGVNQAVLEEHHGWSRGSDKAARYIAVFQEDGDREIARAHGVEITEEEPDSIAPLECPRCGRETPRDEDFCVWCNQAVNHGVQEQLKADQREARTALLKIAEQDPEFLDEVRGYQDVIAFLDENPELMRDAEEFVSALNN